MAKYIDAEAAKADGWHLKRITSIGDSEIVEVRDITSLPAADVVEVRHGRWIEREDMYYGWNIWECSLCREEFCVEEGTPKDNEYNYCPNCGAKMEGDGECGRF